MQLICSPILFIYFKFILICNTSYCNFCFFFVSFINPFYKCISNYIISPYVHIKCWWMCVETWKSSSQSHLNQWDCELRSSSPHESYRACCPGPASSSCFLYELQNDPPSSHLLHFLCCVWSQTQHKKCCFSPYWRLLCSWIFPCGHTEGHWDVLSLLEYPGQEDRQLTNVPTKYNLMETQI